ncbi:MAG: M24 family metallopeptidase [Betaproteobacteria bacterium]
MAFTAADYSERQERFLAACDELALDAILVCANGSCFGLSGTAQGYMSFLCGWNSFDSPSVLILRRGRAPFLIVAHHRMKMMALDTVTDVEIEWIDQGELGTGVARALEVSRRQLGRIGICGWEDMQARPWKTIEQALGGAPLIDVKERIVPLRAVKSPAQLAIHRQVAAICDEMFAALAGMRVTGQYTYAIKAELELLARRRGCDFVQHWMTAAHLPDYPRYFPHENRQVPKRGDTLLYGMMMTLDGVWGHAVRCYRVGDPDPHHERIQRAVVEYQQAFIDMMRPHADLREVVRKGLKQAAAINTVTGDPNTRMLRLGHALGYSYTDPGASEAFPRSYYALESEHQRSRAVILEPGMVFEVHPQFYYASGAAGVGDMIEMTQDGARSMTTYRRDVIYVPA